MIVSNIMSRARTSQATQPGAEAPAERADPAPSHALVPLESPQRGTDRYAARPSAPFVAHLIAMAEQAQQTRSLRRETPDIYGRVAAGRAGSFDNVLSQSA